MKLNLRLAKARRFFGWLLPALLVAPLAISETRAEQRLDPNPRSSSVQPKAAASVPASKNALPKDLAPLAEAMQQELLRSLEHLKRPGRDAPYFLGYWLIELEHHHVEARYGELVDARSRRQRFLRAEVRVGSHELDSSNYFAVGGMSAFAGMGAPVEQAPIDDDPHALRRGLWLLTDNTYQNALELLEQKRAERQSSVKASTQPDDFTRDTPASIVDNDVKPLPSRATLAEHARKASSVFLLHPDVYDAQVTGDAWSVRRLFVSSDGVLSFAPARYVRYSVRAAAQADDGMPITRVLSDFGELTQDQLLEMAKHAAADVTQQRAASLTDDYSGPVLFEGQAAAQLLFELLGSTLSGTPNSDFGESPWLRRLGKRVMPKTFRVFDDPNLDRHRSLTLWGGYTFDDDGLPPERVELVERGRLRSFLMSRSPNEHITSSNGHGRAGMGGFTQGAVGNLVVESEQGLGQAALRRRMLNLVKEEGGAYGLVVSALEAREYTTGGAVVPRPEVVFKLYLDGKEEPVRGAELHDLSPRALKDIVAAGRDLSVYSFTPAVAGSLPAAASVAAPSLLFEDVDVRKPSAAHELPPVLPRPAVN